MTQLKHLVVALAAILALGLVPALAVAEHHEHPNPCASEENPCASEENPCAEGENPCAEESNPCSHEE